jgi:hypothetical protein
MKGIPKVVHQIWIGNNPIPHEWIKTIKDFCDDYAYTYKLWTEDCIDELWRDEFPGLRDVYNSTERLSGKCNILRLLILFYHGGIYIDADCVLLHPEKFVEFIQENKGETFFAWEKLSQEHFKKFSKPTLENSDMHNRKKIIANSIIGACKGDKFIELLLAYMPKYYWENYGKGTWRESGPGYVANVYDLYRDKIKNVRIYSMNTFYSKGWVGGITKDQHLDYTKSKGMFFQYGYSTNNFAKILS